MRDGLNRFSCVYVVSCWRKLAAPAYFRCQCRHGYSAVQFVTVTESMQLVMLEYQSQKKELA